MISVLYVGTKWVLFGLSLKLGLQVFLFLDATTTFATSYIG